MGHPGEKTTPPKQKRLGWGTKTVNRIRLVQFVLGAEASGHFDDLDVVTVGVLE